MRFNCCGNVEWIGLPECLKQQLATFSSDEIAKYPGTLLKVILGQLYNPKQALKDSGEITTQIIQAANIKTEDPCPYYKIVGPVGSGGFAKCYECIRVSDGQRVCLKFFNEPKSAKERHAIEYEIGIMQMSQNDHIVNCIEAFDF